MAATLAGMLHGIENKIDPGDATTAAVTGRDENLPLNMSKALATTFSNAALINTMGSDLVELYCRHRSAETAAFENYINPREYDWYL
jgi:glutamine synthetase